MAIARPNPFPLQNAEIGADSTLRSGFAIDNCANRNFSGWMTVFGRVTPRSHLPHWTQRVASALAAPRLDVGLLPNRKEALPNRLVALIILGERCNYETERKTGIGSQSISG